jgi:DNA primase
MRTVPQQQVEQIRDRNDIVEVIGAHVKLHKAGASFKGLCPFHKEKTPSFHVQPARQAFHCFGCGKGGDVFRFVMEYENVDFPTSLRLLAQRAGVVLELTETAKRETSRKDQLYDVHRQVAELYRTALREAPDAESARDYLRGRALDGEIAETFQIGYAPARSDTLAAWAARRKIPLEALVTAGLVYAPDERSRTPADRFQNRLMFPIWDETGRVIGFSGRVLRKEDHPAKYVNSPETPLFHKSRVLYALHLARRAIGEAKYALLCEGQIDTIRCHAAGFANALAAQGTAATEDHARILRRYTDEVVLLLDSDEAGQNAAERTAGLFLAEGLLVRVAALPTGEDPDSYLLRHGADALRALIRDAPGAALALIARFERRGDLTTETGVARAAKAAVELVARAPDAVPRDLMIRQVASKLRVQEDALRQDIRRILQRAPRTAVAPAPEPTAATGEPPPEELALLEHLLQQRDQPGIIQCARDFLPIALLTHAVCRELYSLLLDHADDPDWNPAAARPEDGEFTRIAARLVLAPVRSLSQEVPSEQAAQDMIRGLWRKALERARTDTRARLRSADPGKTERLEEESAELTRHLRQICRDWSSARAVIELRRDAD